MRSALHSLHPHMVSLHDEWQDAGGGSPPTFSGTLKLWLRADLGITLNGSKVSAWADQSGNGNNVTQGTAADQPPYTAADSNFNGRPSVGPFSSTSYALNASTFTISQPNTIYLVAYAANTAQNVFFDGSSSRQIIGRAGATTWWIYAGTTVDANGANGNPHAFCLTLSSGTGTLYVDNSQTAAVSSTAGSDALTGLVVGVGSGDAAPNGSIAEFLIYSGAHTTAQVQQVFRYLGARYGLATS